VRMVPTYSQNVQSRQQFKYTLEKTERRSNQEWIIQGNLKHWVNKTQDEEKNTQH